jgi:hypothetical protein
MAQPTNPIGIRSVGFINPTDPTGSAIDAQQIQRQQELADALQQRALTPIQVQSGNISWTQGLAQLADAIAGNHLRRQANASQWDAGTRAQNARTLLHYGEGAPQIDPSTNPYSSSERGRNFGQRVKDFVAGGPPTSSISSLAAAITPKPTSSTSPAQPSVSSIAPSQVAPPPLPANGPGGANDPSKPVLGISLPANGGVIPPAPQPRNTVGNGNPALSIPQPASPSQSQPMTMTNVGADASVPQPLQSPRDQLMPTMSADQGMYAEANDPQGFWKGVLDSAQPTDVVKNLMAQGLRPGTPAFNTALGNINRKAGFIEPTNIREGSTVMSNDGSGGSYYAPHVPVGYQPQHDAHGRLLGIVPVAGGPQAVEGSEHARSIGAAGGEVTSVYNPQTQQMEYVPKTTVLTNGTPNPGAPQPTGGQRGATGAGPISSALSGNSGGGNRYASAPPLGAPAAASTYGTAQGAAFASIQDSARDAPQRISALRDMQHIVNSGLATGPAQKVMQDFGEKHGLNFLTSGAGFVFNKDAARYTAQLAGEVGLNGSDARLGLVGKATPGMQMPKAALNEVIPTYIGLELAKTARASAANTWVQQHGPGDNAGFETAWRQNYDPRLFTQMAKGPDAFAANVAHLNPASKEYYHSKLKALTAMGVDFGAMTQ